MSIQFGFHASSGGHLEKLPESVKNLGGECFQFFSRNPYGGKVTLLDGNVVNNFRENCRKTGIINSYIHAPYFINLASKNNRIFYGSVKAIQDEIERAETLGAQFVVTHIGSAKDFKEKILPLSEAEKTFLPKKYRAEISAMAEDKKFSPAAFKRVVEGLSKIVAGRNKVSLLLEIAAGAGAILGVKIEELAFYLESVPALAGFCFDTAHAFASGYDLRTKKELTATFSKIENILGKDKIKLIHLNDSIGTFGSKIDRHAHLGEGSLGKEAFRNLVDYLRKKRYNVDMVLETPTIEGIKKDLVLLKKFRTEN